MTNDDHTTPGASMGTQNDNVNQKFRPQTPRGYTELCSVLGQQATTLHKDIQMKLSANTSNVMQQIANQGNVTDRQTKTSFTPTVTLFFAKVCTLLGLRPMSLPKLAFSTGTLASVVLFSFLFLPQLQTNDNVPVPALPFLSSPTLLEVVFTTSEEDLLVIEDLDLYETLLNEPL